MNPAHNSLRSQAQAARERRSRAYWLALLRSHLRVPNDRRRHRLGRLTPTGTILVLVTGGQR